MDLVTQDSYERRHKQSKIPPELAKKIKEEPVQKIQPRNKQIYRTNAETATKNNNCGFHKCSARTVDCNNGHNLGHFAIVWRSKTDSTRKQKINYFEETYNEEEESESEEIQQITQINKGLPNENENYGIKLKINHKYQIFTIHTGSPVTQPRTLRPKRYQTVKRKISRRKQKRN